MEEIKNIEIKDLSFTYPTSEKRSLKNISLDIYKGEFITICGKSGCGKSTLLKHLKPVIAPNGKREGEILFEGRNIFELTHREQAEKIGYVMQSPDNQIASDKVWHEIAFGLESFGLPMNEIRARVAEMASYFDITDWFYKKTTELSGGQKQLVNLASIVVMQPSVLILDEPTSQLDPIAAHDFLETIAKLNQDLGITVILTEHRLEEAFAVSDRVVVMDDGEIIAAGTPREVCGTLYDISNDMILALPTPTRIYKALEKNNAQIPLTVREGRHYLSQKQFVNQIEEKKEKQLLNGCAAELKDIWFRYEKNQPDIIKGLSLKIKKGELYAILGGNGAGKTTTLSVIAGLRTAYRGKVIIHDNLSAAVLPQNPQSLFVKKTVYQDLQEVIDKKNGKSEQRLGEIIEFCELGELLKKHPYDLSGGEQQRAALAKILLCEPDILLLDEPTKGLDAHFKIKLAHMLKGLQKSGITIIMVSHDVEFCAKYADRCGLFFDGSIVSENTARKFFVKNSFYTTAANRMSRGILDGAVLDEDVICALGGEIPKIDNDIKKIGFSQKSDKTIKEKKKTKKYSVKGMIAGVVFALCFFTLMVLENQGMEINKYVYQGLEIIFAALSLACIVPQSEIGVEAVQVPKSDRKLRKRTIAAAALILLAIPLTIFTGVFYLGDRKYYFISLLIILETMLPFGLIFEGRKPQARELVIISVMCALAVAGRAAFYMLPEFKPVLAIVIISGICFGGETGFLVGAVTGFVSNFFFGQGPWTPWQMFAFGIVGFLAGVLFRKGFLRKTKLSLAVFGFLAAILIYGGIMNPASVIMNQTNINIKMFMSAYLMGLPFDLIHAAATAFFLWFISEPMTEKLERVKVKYGLIEK